MGEGTRAGQGKRNPERRSASIYFNRKQLEQLDQLSYERDVSRAVLVRTAVEQFLAREAKRG